MTKLTKKQAVEEMVSKFNAVKQSLIAKAYPCCEGFDEITPKKLDTGCTVSYVGDTYYLWEYMDLEVVRVTKDSVILRLTDETDIGDYGNTISVCKDEIEIVEGLEEYDGWLPMWGWLWTVDSCTEQWIRSNLEKMADLGFRIYEDEEGDIYIGIDGAGYDFYENHWMPLYDAMGLMWHR